MWLRLFIFTIVLQSLLLAADGDLDTSFGGNGKVISNVGGSDAAQSIAIQSDGKIVVAGYSDVYGDFDFVLSRYNNNGSYDTAFASGGIVITDMGSPDDYAFGVAIQSDGKIVVAGITSRLGINGRDDDFAIVRYNTNGSLDTTFGSNGEVTTSVGGDDDVLSSIAIQSDGKIVVAGYSWNGIDWDFALVRYNTNGSPDFTFNYDGKSIVDVNGFHDKAQGVAIQSDGKIVVAGRSDNVSGSDFALLRYNSNGYLDMTFGTNGKAITDMGSAYDDVSSVAIQSNGKIIVAGSSEKGSNDDFAVARYNTNGTLDTTFSGDGKVVTDVSNNIDISSSVAIQSDGKIVVAGRSWNGSNGDFSLVRYSSSGSLDMTFGTNGKVITDLANKEDGGNSVAIQSDGKIIVAGYSDNSSNWDFALVRYQGTPVTLAPIYYLLQ